MSRNSRPIFCVVFFCAWLKEEKKFYFRETFRVQFRDDNKKEIDR